MENSSSQASGAKEHGSPASPSAFKVILITAALAGLIAGGAFLTHQLLDGEGKEKSAEEVKEKPAELAPEKVAKKPAEKLVENGVEKTEEKESPPTPSTGAPDELKSRCLRDLELLRKSFNRIPDDYRKAPSLSQLTRDVKVNYRRCEEFLSRCIGTPGYHEVQFMLARLQHRLWRVEWMAQTKRFKDQGYKNSDFERLKPQWRKQYFGRIIEMASAALEKAEKGSELRSRCLELLGDGLFQASREEEALENYLKLLEEFPRFERRSLVYMAIARCYQGLKRYDEGARILRKGIEELPDDPYWPSFFGNLWQIHTYAGNLQSLLETAEEILTLFPEQLRKEGIGMEVKQNLERSLAYTGFRLGYSRFALGDYAGASDAFRNHISYLDNLAKELAKKKSGLPQDYMVYLGRSRDNLKVLEERVGKPMPADLDSVTWLGGRTPDYRGRPLAIIFRNYTDERSAPVTRDMDRHINQHLKGIELVVISFMKTRVSEKNPYAARDEEEKCLEEARKLELQCPVGLDPDWDKKSLFRRFEASVGSATFIIVDVDGNYAWFQQDPWTRDVNFSLAILRRISGLD